MNRLHPGVSQPPHLRDPLAEAHRDRLVQLREEVAVAVERHVDRGVAHAHLDRLRVGALGDGQRHACVPEVVESAGQTGSVEDRLEVVLPEARRDQRVGGLVREHE